ncbi:MAG: response regulator [Candidatus Methanoperedens sp.]|nr:response regulator [Candidatus Methanoperedens sp.]MCZ7406175.1 response regulator [Candidatus Methanoperedens sp.]
MENEKYRNKILVVDDEPVNVKLITGILENDYEIIPAYSGREALLKITSDKPDIVLLDIMMPEISGYEVCEKIRKQETTRFIPVVMVTALTGLDEKIKAIEAGADDFLTKPISVVELVARVKSLLKTKYFHDQLVKSKEKIEAQNDFKTVMANVLPLLLQQIPPDKKNEIIQQMSKHVEALVWQKYIRELPGNPEQTANISCSVMNRLGGCFSVERAGEKGYTIINKKCPWGNDINPVLCMLTKAIFARIGVHVFNDIDINLTKTIASGDGHCLIQVIVRKDS